ncbi:MAG: 5-formyltetrahydrofolate cyclo-ligase [Candidatus Schekmanbacteria bacterium]|nr:5-formyltetrahydrofolate cyclo-ligase [Candidatus Schekmanbacteria bacterium]
MKSILRKQIKQLRKQLTWQEVAEKSLAVQNLLFSLPEFKQSRSVMFYASYQKEVRTHEAIKKTLAEQKQVILPLIDQKTAGLKLIPISNYPDDVEPGLFGIPQPINKGQAISLDLVELIILPGVAFDYEGNRLGYGGGFYDKLLANQKKPTIALAFELQIIAEVPRQSHDIQVDKIVTEERVIICNP